LIYGPRVIEFYGELLGDAIRHYDFTWFRPVGPGKGTPAHGSAGPGTTLFFTAGPNGEMDGLLGTLLPVTAEKAEADEQ
jgi:hypothetical protein